jgi:Fe-S-cluster-containing dehydrogenase component
MSRPICPFLAMDISEMDISEMTSLKCIGIQICPFPICPFYDKQPFLPYPKKEEN